MTGSDPRFAFDRERVWQLLTLLERLAAGETQELLPISPAHDELDAIAHGINVLIGELGWATACFLEAQQERAAMAERALVDNAVRESEARFRLIANTAPVKIWIADVAQQWTYVNQHWLTFTGRSVEATLGAGWTDSLHPDDRAAALEAYANAFERREPFEMEYRLRRHDGEYRWITSVGVPRFTADGAFAGCIGSALDVTQHKRAEETLSTLSQRLLEAQEGERAHLARELHDDISQRLGLLVWRLDGLTNDLRGSPRRVREQIEHTREDVITLMQDVQALSHRLHPARLELLGLAAASAALCQEVADQQGTTITFRAGNIPRDLPARISLSLFRVLQEALQNAIKHSGALQVHVVLDYRVDRLELTVRDDGTGFGLGDAASKPGLGLTSMTERMKAVEGQLLVHSTSQQGTTIEAWVNCRLSAHAKTAPEGNVC
jgi:PAS domain S-box-containing protein